MKKLEFIFKIMSMLPGPIFIGTGLYWAVLGFIYFAGPKYYDQAFGCLAAWLPIALAGVVLFLPNKLVHSSRTMIGIALVALSVLMHQTDPTLHSWGILEGQALPIALTMVCLIAGVISFVMYSIRKQKGASPFLALLLIPFLAGILGSGNSQWCRFIYIYQAYVDPWSPGPPNRPRCPRKYTGRWTEWFPNGKKKMEKNLQRGIYHGTPSKKEWYPSGQMKHRMNYIDGQKYYTTWHENGEKKLETDAADGTWTFWDESGKKREGRLVQMHEKRPDLPYQEAHYKNGKLHGKLTEWDHQGNVTRLVYYDNGKLVESE